MTIKRKFPETITHKIFETNSKCFLLVLTKFLFCQGDWPVGYHSMKFRYFPDIS